MNTKYQGAFVSLLFGVGLMAASAVSRADVLFQENFGSGLGQFSSLGDVATGTYGARMYGCYGCQDGTIVSVPISTVGYSDIKVTFTRSSSGLDTGEYGIAEWSSNGSTYTVMESSRSVSGATTFNLPTGAAGQSGLRLRFRVDASLSSEYYTVDTITVEGTSTGTGGGGGVQIGPNPTTSALESSSGGSFTVESVSVPSSAVTGFDGGLLYYPTATGQYGGIVLCPGYTASSSSLSWWGTRLASWGFIVLIIDTNSIYDQPSDRATQLMAGVAWLKERNQTSSSAIYGKLRESDMAVGGHSMGGGGTLIALRDNPSLKTGFAMTPWNSSTNFSAISQPTFILGCESDSVAPNSSHSIPFYNSISSGVKKVYAEVNGADHFCPNSSDAKMGKYGIAWYKRYLDGDTRFTPWLCPSATGGNGTVDSDLSGLSSYLSDYRSTCPF